jgi:hypothetical protein
MRRIAIARVLYRYAAPRQSHAFPSSRGCISQQQQQQQQHHCANSPSGLTSSDACGTDDVTDEIIESASSIFLSRWSKRSLVRYLQESRRIEENRREGGGEGERKRERAKKKVKTEKDKDGKEKEEEEIRSPAGN